MSTTDEKSEEVGSGPISIRPGDYVDDFEIRERLGTGAMGEVFRGFDGKLDREVAIKFLSPSLASDEDYLKRFRNEAKLLASLSHPNIAHLHDLREHNGSYFLIMEMARGETLAEIFRRGPMSVREAVPVFVQVGQALEAAHELGIIHRDLKPDNIMVSRLGTVKVLDFGLAKHVPTGPFTETNGDSSPPASPQDITRPGVLVGTPTYMSPEQARGEEIDKRTDIWAFGCCLFQALTGEAPFKAGNMSDTLANILANDPDWGELPGNTPAGIEFLLRRCLEKDMKERLRDIGDGLHELQVAQSRASSVSLERFALYRALAFRGRPWRRRLGALALVAAALAAVVMMYPFEGWSKKGTEAVARLAIPLAPGYDLESFPRSVVVTADGSRLVYVGSGHGTTQLFVREMDELLPRALPRTQDAKMPFFSPDGAWIAYFAQGSLKKVPAQGGAPVTIAKDIDSNFGGTWGEDGTIVFAGWNDRGLFRVNANGGEPSKLTDVDAEKDERGHWWPRFLPEGKGLLFTCYTNNSDNATLEVIGLDAPRERKAIASGVTDARYLPTGHLAYVQESTLYAVPFNLAALEITGQPAPLMHDVRMGRAGRHGLFDVASNGTLVYAVTRPGPRQSQLVKVNRQGDVIEELNLPPGDYAFPRFSKNGKHVILRVAHGTERQIHLYDLETDISRPITSSDHAESNFLPTWRGADDVLFASDKEGHDQIYSVYAYGDSPPELVFGDTVSVLPGTCSSDGTLLFYMRQDPETQEDLYVYDFDSPGDPRLFLASPAREAGPAISPSGEWLAYTSDTTESWQVYIRSTQEDERVYQVSRDGGMEPVWARKGHELYYRNRNQVFAVSFQNGEEPVLGQPELLFEGRYRREWNLVPEYDVFDDTFLFVKYVDSPIANDYLAVTLNWFEEVRRGVDPGQGRERSAR